MKIINTLSQILMWAAMAVSVELMLLTVADVGGRYIFNQPITGTTELTEDLMACLMVSMAPCALAGRHIKIDILFSRLRPRMQDLLDILFNIIGLAGVAFLALAGFHQARVMLDAGTTSSMLNIPDFPFIMVLVVSYAVLGIFMFVLLAKKIGEVAKR